VEHQGDERTSNDDEEKHACGVELDGSIDGMPEVLGGGAVDDGDETEMASGDFTGIDDARTGETEKTVALVGDFRGEETV